VNELESSAFLLASPPRLRFADRPYSLGFATVGAVYEAVKKLATGNLSNVRCLLCDV